MLSRYYDSADLLSRNAAAGGTALLVARGQVLELRRGVPRRVGRLPPPSDADHREWAQVAESLSGDNDLWAWPASWFDGQVGPLVADRLEGWITATMPGIVAAARAFSAVYERTGVDGVVTPFLSNSIEIGAFTAANVVDGPKTIVVEHGDIAHAAESWDLNLLASDAVVVPTRELAEHLTARRENYGEEAGELIVGSYRWPRYARLAHRSASRAPAVDSGEVDPRKPTLVYLVTALAADSRYLNNAWYPDAWYFRLQAAIVDALEKHRGFNVVVKLFPVTEHDVSPLADYVADKKAPHLWVSRAPFSDWLPFADRVVVDMASTGLYEALVAGCPSLGLVWRNHPVRRGAISALGPALVPFSTYDEAATAVDDFASALQPSAPSLTPEGADMLESLVALCRPA